MIINLLAMAYHLRVDVTGETGYMRTSIEKRRKLTDPSMEIVPLLFTVICQFDVNSFIFNILLDYIDIDTAQHDQ